MVAARDGTAPEPTGGLDQRVLSALQGLPGHVAFSGLRRILHAHPESLSRSLRRLEREGLVERSAEGYRALGEFPASVSPSPADLRPIGQVELPPGISPESVFGRLTGRWFGTLRWVGLVDGAVGRLLVWARRDGTGYVLLGIHQRLLRVYVRDERTGDDASEDEDSAYELLGHAVDAVRPPYERGSGTVRYLLAYDEPAADPLNN